MTDVKVGLREILHRDGITIMPGLTDVMSARIYKSVGFECLWAGGFMSSGASLGLPDANLLSITEHAQYVKNVVLSTGLPVLVDIDNGGGGILNVIRAVREIEQAGAAGIVLEDQDFPKHCALFLGGRPIIDTAEMVGKLRAACDARVDPNFVIIARTDAFGAGLSVDEAIARAKAYEAVGIDALLPISKNFANLANFAKQADLSIPMVIAPTLFPEAGTAELNSLGYKIVIQPLMGAQASYKALIDAMKLLTDEGAPQGFVDRMLTFEQLSALAGVPEATAAEDRYLPMGSDMRDRAEAGV